MYFNYKEKELRTKFEFKESKNDISQNNRYTTNSLKGGSGGGGNGGGSN